MQMRMGTKLRFWTRALELEYMALNMSPAITINVNPPNYKQNTAALETRPNQLFSLKAAWKEKASC